MCVLGFYYSLGWLPIGSDDREVLCFMSIPVSVVHSCQCMHNSHYKCMEMSIVIIRNTSEAVLWPQYIALWAEVSMMAFGRIVALILPPLCLLCVSYIIITRVSQRSHLKWPRCTVLLCKSGMDSPLPLPAMSADLANVCSSCRASQAPECGLLTTRG